MNRMLRNALSGAVVAFAFAAMPASADMMGREKTVQVGGAPMFASKNIIQNAVNSKDHTTLVAAVKAAGLVETLSSPGPFTVFAPTNAAFAALPAGTVETLLKPENKGQLVTVLTYHVVPGKLSAKDLWAKVKAGGGKTTLATAQGGQLIVAAKGNKLVISGMGGGMGQITIADVNQSNGVIHVVNGVILPK